MSTHLGPTLARRPLHLFWLLDVSGSMAVDGKIDALNAAMTEAVQAVQESAADNPGLQVMVRAVTFAHDAEWHVAEPIDIETFAWEPISAIHRGTTELGRAVGLVTTAIDELSAQGRGVPPALVLVSDGKPTDLKAPSFGSSLRALADHPWGAKASRIAIGIGADADIEALGRFIGHDEMPPLRAGNAAQLTSYLRWASTVVVDDASRMAQPQADQALDANATPLVADVPPPAPVDESTVDSQPEAPTTPVGPEPATPQEPPPPPPTGDKRSDLPPPPPTDKPRDIPSPPAPDGKPRDLPPPPPPTSDKPRDVPPPQDSPRNFPPPIGNDEETVW